LIPPKGVADAAHAELWDDLLSRLWWNHEGWEVFRVRKEWRALLLREGALLDA
jgi:hypothetical protein